WKYSSTSTVKKALRKGAAVISVVFSVIRKGGEGAVFRPLEGKRMPLGRVHHAAPHVRLGRVLVVCALAGIGMLTLRAGDAGTAVSTPTCLVCSDFALVDAFLNVLLFIP